MTERHEPLVDLLQAVNRGMFELIRDVLDRHGLPVASRAVMHQISHTPGITLSEISRRTGMAKSHVSKTINGLEQQGLLERRPDPADQRAVRLHPTPRAAAHFAQFQAEMRERLSAVVAALPEERLDPVIAGLQALKTALGQGKGC